MKKEWWVLQLAGVSGLKKKFGRGYLCRAAAYLNSQLSAQCCVLYSEKAYFWPAGMFFDVRYAEIG